MTQEIREKLEVLRAESGEMFKETASSSDDSENGWVKPLFIVVYSLEENKNELIGMEIDMDIRNKNDEANFRHLIQGVVRELNIEKSREDINAEVVAIVSFHKARASMFSKEDYSNEEISEMIKGIQKPDDDPLCKNIIIDSLETTEGIDTQIIEIIEKEGGYLEFKESKKSGKAQGLYFQGFL